jgi:hypothetical protein
MQLRSLKFSSLVLAALVSAAFFVMAVSVQAEPTPQTRADTVTNDVVLSNAQSTLDGENFSYTSNVYSAPFPFNVLAMSWSEDLGDSREPGIEVRFQKTDGDWDVWQTVHVDEDSRTPATPNPAALIFPKSGQAMAAQYRFALQRSIDVEQRVSDIELTAIDSVGTPTHLSRFQTFVNRVISPLTARAAPAVISRAGWGADESYRYASDGKTLLWPTEYVTPTTFIIHHTAGANGQPDLATAEATIRGIYYYHAKVRGWGDIGYNYLIDQAGNVFEGRAGGDGIVAGHTYRDAGCKSKGGVANLNRGSMGIAVLGDYQNDDTVTPATLNALQQFIGAKGRELGIAPMSVGAFDGRTDMPNIITHRDVDCSTCPGESIYVNLDTIRANAQSVYDSTVVTERATVVGQSDASITFNAGSTKDMWIDVRNDGTQTWLNDNASTPVLEVSVPAAARHSSWVSSTTVAQLSTPEVAPGGVGRFAFTIQAPTDRLQETINFQVRWGDILLSTSPIPLSLTMMNLPYSATWSGTTIPVAMIDSSTRKVRVAYTNTGTRTWKRGDVKLKTWHDGNLASLFRGSGWSSQYGMFSMEEASVAPGGVAHFSFSEKAPAKGGTYLQQFVLLKRDLREVPGSLGGRLTRVDARFRMERVNTNFPIALGRNWSRTVTVKVKNTGKSTWTRNTVLELVNESGRVSALSHSSWPNANVMRAKFQQTRVKPGQTATFVFRVRAPSKAGVYKQRFQVKSSATGSVVENGSWRSLIRIDAR